MQMSMEWVLMILLMIGVLAFISHRKHLLSMLLSLEFIVLNLYLFLFCYLMYYNYEFYFMMMFLTFSVCEGALGLSILVSMVRVHGNDYFQSFSVF